MKKQKNFLIVICGCFILFTACAIGKKVQTDINKVSVSEEDINKIVDIVDSNDVTKLDAIINNENDMAVDKELQEFFVSSDIERGDGLMSLVMREDSIEVKDIGKNTIIYKITAPDLSKLFFDMKETKVSEENIESYISEYVSNAEKITTEVEISYTNQNGKFSANYRSEEFINALTGNLVTAYQQLMQDAINEVGGE